MRKEILPEMFNYNKYPGPDFVCVADLLKSDACQFTVLENHKDALDATRFGQRFSGVLCYLLKLITVTVAGRQLQFHSMII